MQAVVSAPGMRTLRYYLRVSRPPDVEAIFDDAAQGLFAAGMVPSPWLLLCDPSCRCIEIVEVSSSLHA